MHATLLAEEAIYGSVDAHSKMAASTVRCDAGLRSAVVKRARKRLAAGFYDRADVLGCTIDRVLAELTCSGGAEERLRR